MSLDRGAAFRALGGAFASGGAAYDRLRPGYPGPVLDWLLQGLSAGAVVVDVGAGTGKLTSALSDRSLCVVAVDPSADMLNQLEARLPAVTTQLGTGEATGLPDSCADLVTYAQSWHWVEPAAGAAELARVLRPGGRAGWVWNFLDVSVRWVADLAEIWHTVAGQDVLDADRQAPQLAGPFGPLETLTHRWAEPMTVSDLAALVTTRSYFLRAAETEQQRILLDAEQFLAREFPGQIAVSLPYVTHAFQAVRGL